LTPRKSNDQDQAAISESELVVLKVLWERGALKVGEVLEALEQQGYAWVYNTVQTLLNRLKQKHFVATKKEGRALAYHPLIDRDAFVQLKMEAVATQVFDGATSQVVMALVEQQKFTKGEIDQFKALLERLSEKASDENDGL